MGTLKLTVVEDVAAGAAVSVDILYADSSLELPPNGIAENSTALFFSMSAVDGNIPSSYFSFVQVSTSNLQH
jgi:hypothetical protein